jgi:hypothetical protein
MTSDQKPSRTLLWIKDHSIRLLALLVIGLFLLGLGLRLYDLTDQPIDFHATRQLRNAVVARAIFYEKSPGADAGLRDLAIRYRNSTGQYEPPILETIVALTYLVIGQEELWVSRLYTTLFWTIGGIALFALAHRMAKALLEDRGNNNRGPYIPVISTLVPLAYYLVLPFAVQASRSFQPDPGMVMWIILCVYALYRWSEKPSWKWALLAGALGGVAILAKIVAVYILAGAAVALILFNSLQEEKKFFGLLRNLWNPQIWVIAILMLAPAFSYYFSRGARSNEYFTNWMVAFSHLLLEPWLYARWLNTVRKLVGVLPLLLSLVGILVSKSRGRALLIGLWLGYVAYGFFLPYQMYTHSYYHLQLVPIVALSLAPVTLVSLQRLDATLSGRTQTQRIAIYSLISVLSLAVLLYSSWQALVPLYGRDYRNEPGYWQEIAAQLPDDGKIMALTQDYGYRLMYYGWRKVTLWPNRGERQLMDMRGSDKSFAELFAERAEGKSYFLVTSFNQFNDQPTLKQTLYDHYPILAETPGYIIFDLRRPSGGTP